MSPLIKKRFSQTGFKKIAVISAALHDEPSMIISPANHKRDNVTGLNSDTCFWPIDHLAIKKNPQIFDRKNSQGSQNPKILLLC